jgi:hypothetical protein
MLPPPNLLNLFEGVAYVVDRVNIDKIALRVSIFSLFNKMILSIFVFSLENASHIASY